jgi:uncharacterized membrane protein YgdD (TMEM256/DUF423 family)
MQPHVKHFIVLGALSAAAAIGLGAFGAHALRDTLTPAMRDVYQTAVLYHLVHSLGLLAVAFVCSLRPHDGWIITAGYIMAFGMFLFTGTLYLLAATGIRWIGALTPFGGVAMIVAWLLLAWATMSRRNP